MVFFFSLTVFPLKRKSGKQDCFIFNLPDKYSLGVYSGEGTPGTPGCRDEESMILLLGGKGVRHVKQLWYKMMSAVRKRRKKCCGNVSSHTKCVNLPKAFKKNHERLFTKGCQGEIKIASETRFTLSEQRRVMKEHLSNLKPKQMERGENHWLPFPCAEF